MENSNFECVSVPYDEQIANEQASLLDYLKLCLKQSDEYKEKYRQAYKQSKSESDLYYSHLFEGMGEAYDDLIKRLEKHDIYNKRGEQI